MNDLNKLKRIMFRANYLRKNQSVLLRGAQLPRKTLNSLTTKQGWYYEHFADLLRSGTYRFSYFKKDGTIREAVGTLNMDLIPAEHLPKSLSAAQNDSSESPATFCYYDLSVPGWRSFCIDLFIGFVEKVA